MNSVWTEIEVAGRAVMVFPAAAPSRSGQFVLYLRDRPDPPLQDQKALLDLLASHGLTVMEPQIAHWWLDRRAGEFTSGPTPLQWLRTVVAEVASLWNLLQPRAAVLGSGTGGEGALQLGYRYPREFPVVAAIAPAVDFHAHYATDPVLQDAFGDAESARQETATLRVHPLNWPPHQWLACDPDDAEFDGCERLASKLASIGIPFDADLTTTAQGRRDEYVVQMLPRAIGFLSQRLSTL